MKLVFLWIACSVGMVCSAQSKLSIYTGWTASSTRVSYPDYVRLGSASEELINLGMMHTPYFGGVEYEYDYRKIRLSTGLSFMVFGAGKMPYVPEAPWKTYYWVIPLLAGYHIELPNSFGLTIEIGLDVGIQQGGNGFIEADVNRFNVNAVLGIEGSWNRFRLGVRGHLGLTRYRTYSVFTYKHTGITTYLGYTLWDHAKCKARRLKKQQEKNLE